MTAAADIIDVAGVNRDSIRGGVERRGGPVSQPRGCRLPVESEEEVKRNWCEDLLLMGGELRCAMLRRKGSKKIFEKFGTANFYRDFWAMSGESDTR